MCVSVAQVRPLFVAPHYDDVALSCGGAVALAARTGRPLILTVFGGQSAGPASDFAQFQHQRWGLHPEDVVDARREEDLCAAKALGASVERTSFEFLDAIYRSPAYDSDAALFGEIIDADAGLASDIAARLAELAVDKIYVPHGIGNHVDHQIVRDAGRLLAARGFSVWSYAEVPYVLTHPQTLRAFMHAADPDRTVVLDDDALQRRIAAIGCYASQVPVLFRDLGDPASTIRSLATTLGSGIPVEVFAHIG
jgi:LmbE family N-acetylglucosaminyl deacetylase